MWVLFSLVARKPFFFFLYVLMKSDLSGDLFFLFFLFLSLFSFFFTSFHGIFLFAMV